VGIPRALLENDGPSSPKVSDYLVGSQLDEAIAAGHDLSISWPFMEAQIADWTQAEAIWKHVLFKTLGLRRTQMESPVLLSIFPGNSRSTCESICQMFFERFNVAGFSILERPTAQIYAANALHGVVVDIGSRYTDVTPIYDGSPLHYARTSTPLGVYHCIEYLAAVLRSNNSIVNVLSPPESPLSPEKLHETFVDLARHIYRKGLIKAPAVSGSAATTGEVEDDGVTDIASILVAGKERAVIEANIKKRANQKASPAEQAKLREIEALDLVTVEFDGKELTIGKERHRFCDPLFDPRALRNLPGLQPSGDDKPLLSVSEVAGHALAKTEVDQRQYMLGSPHAAGGVLFTGEVTNHVKGLGAFFTVLLSRYIISNPEQQVLNEVQPKSIRVLKIPEYFSEYREKGDGYAAFLGGSIVAKVTFHDNQGKNFVSKAEYTEKGPRAVIEMSPSLL